MLTENEIVQTLAEHLRREGYRIDKQLTTLEQGVDIVAIHLATGRWLLVEAKGSTSSKEGTARFGKPFSPNQAKSHVSVAFYCGAKDHQGFVDAISAALKRLAITVYFVDQNRQVRTLSPID